MIYQKQSYVAGNMCDGKLQMSVIAADELVENAVTELMGDLGIDGIVTKAKYNAMWHIISCQSGIVNQIIKKALSCIGKGTKKLKKYRFYDLKC